ncbi:MAG: transporter substrate-binding domain-containing protein [Clostridium sp.]|uniref:transporter substrate-binding domain-containing protein n=1 Tax=Clostridium sp. TaxID=1506 RepID=UPI003D6D4302
MRKSLSFLLIFILIGTLFIGCTSKKNNVNTEDKTLVIGMELAYPPFETKDTQGNPSGVSVDFAKALGEYLKRPVKIENTNWDGLIPSLQTGKVDAVISSMTITQERRKVVDFSVPYAHSYLGLLVNNNSDVTKIEDLNQESKVIDVKKGTTGYIYATAKLTKAKINALSSENACVTEIVQGKADAFIYDQLTIYRQNQSNKKTTKAILIPFQESENWGVAVNKGNSELLNKINDFIKKYKADGGFNKLTTKYMSEEKKIFDNLGFPWFFD